MHTCLDTCTHCHSGHAGHTQRNITHLSELAARALCAHRDESRESRDSSLASRLMTLVRVSRRGECAQCTLCAKSKISCHATVVSTGSYSTSRVTPRGAKTDRGLWWGRGTISMYTVTRTSTCPEQSERNSTPSPRLTWQEGSQKTPAARKTTEEGVVM